MKRALAMIMAIVTCLSCGILLASCGHECEWATDWSKDDTSHWKACTDPECTEVNEKADHVWDAGTEVAFGTTKYVCTVCQQEKTDEKVTSVAEANWASAFELGTNATITLIATNPTAGTMKVVEKRDGSKLSMEETYITPEGETESDPAMYCYFDGEDVYLFDYYKDDGEVIYERELYTYANATDTWKMLIEEMFPEAYIAYSAYTYNAETNLYTASAIADIEELSNLTLAFIDGKIVKLSYIYTEDGDANNYEITVTYGDASVTLPDVNGTVTAEQYASEMDLTGKNFVAEHITGSVGNRGYLQVGFYGDTVTVGVYGPDQYFFHDAVNNKYFFITNHWDNRQLTSKDSFDVYKGYMLHETLAFANMTYNADIQVYKLASATIAGEAATDIVVIFNDGVLDSITYKTNSGGNTKTNTIHYRVENSVPMIPGKSYD